MGDAGQQPYDQEVSVAARDDAQSRLEEGEIKTKHRTMVNLPPDQRHTEHFDEMKDRAVKAAEAYLHVVDYQKEFEEDIYAFIENVSETKDEDKEEDKTPPLPASLESFGMASLAGILVEAADTSQKVSETKDTDKVNAKIPSLLVYLKSFDMGSACYSASHREDGDILVGTADGVQLLSITGDILHVDTSQKLVTGIAAYGTTSYVLHREGDTNKVDISLAIDMSMRSSLFEFARSENTAARFAVSDRYVVAVNPDTLGRLIKYDLASKTIANHPLELEVIPRCLHFLPDGNLLVYSEPRLTKYNLSSGALLEVWRCSGIDNGWGVSSDSNGLIYVCTSSQRVYIISPDGEMIMQISHPKLPDEGGFISIRDDSLTVPGWDDNKLHMFKII